MIRHFLATKLIVLKLSLCWVLTLFPLLYLVALVYACHVDVPVWDEWALAPRIEKAYNGTLGIRDLLQQHVDHRFFFPLLLLIPIAYASDWNIFYWVFMNLVFATGIFILLGRQILLEKNSLLDHYPVWLLPAISITVFSLKQYSNWLGGMQATLFMGCFFAVAGLLVLSNSTFKNLNFLCAIIMGIIATYSFSNNVLFWPVGLCVLLLKSHDCLKRKIIYIISWLTVSAVTLGAFFYDFKSPEYSSSFTFIFQHGFCFLGFVFSLLGFPLAPSNNFGLSCILGIAGFFSLVMSFFILTKRRGVSFDLLLPFFSISLLSIGSSLLIAFGRVAEFQVAGALQSRYITISQFFWVSNLVFLYAVYKGKKMQNEIHPSWEKPLKSISCAAFVLFLVLITAASFISKKEFIQWHAERKEEQAELLALNEDEFFPPEMIYAGVFNEGLAIIRKRHLSFLRDRH